MPRHSELMLLFYQQHHNMFDVTLTDNFQYQSQSIGTGNITWQDRRKNVQIIHNGIRRGQCMIKFNFATLHTKNRINNSD
jgi:hypothetical protein